MTNTPEPSDLCPLCGESIDGPTCTTIPKSRPCPFRAARAARPPSSLSSPLSFLEAVCYLAARFRARGVDPAHAMRRARFVVEMERLLDPCGFEGFPSVRANAALRASGRG